MVILQKLEIIQGCNRIAWHLFVETSILRRMQMRSHSIAKYDFHLTIFDCLLMIQGSQLTKILEVVDIKQYLPLTHHTVHTFSLMVKLFWISNIPLIWIKMCFINSAFTVSHYSYYIMIINFYRSVIYGFIANCNPFLAWSLLLICWGPLINVNGLSKLLAQHPLY